MFLDLDGLDVKLLACIQEGLPLVPEPYRKLAQELRMGEEEVVARLQRLLEAKAIRRLGAVFDSRKIGYHGTLCAFQVSLEDIARVAAEINRHPGVTHNYLRDHEYNMWFTIHSRSQKELDMAVRELIKRTGVTKYLILPAGRVFKIQVKLDLLGEHNSG